jgi:hypothetical protein
VNIVLPGKKVVRRINSIPVWLESLKVETTWGSKLPEPNKA